MNECKPLVQAHRAQPYLDVVLAVGLARQQEVGRVLDLRRAPEPPRPQNTLAMSQVVK